MLSSETLKNRRAAKATLLRALFRGPRRPPLPPKTFARRNPAVQSRTIGALFHEPALRLHFTRAPAQAGQEARAWTLTKLQNATSAKPCRSRSGTLRRLSRGDRRLH